MTRAKDDPRFHRLMGCLQRQVDAHMSGHVGSCLVPSLLDHLRGNLADAWPALMDLEEEPTDPGPFTQPQRRAMVAWCPACHMVLDVAGESATVTCVNCRREWTISTGDGRVYLRPINEWRGANHV